MVMPGKNIKNKSSTSQNLYIMNYIGQENKLCLQALTTYASVIVPKTNHMGGNRFLSNKPVLVDHSDFSSTQRGFRGFKSVATY